MNDTRNRDKPARDLTKREEAALRMAPVIVAAVVNAPTGAVAKADDATIARVVSGFVDALFDRLEHLPELAHEYDEPDFDHEGAS